RRPADGGDQPGWEENLCDELVVRLLGRPVLPGGHQGVDREARRRPEWWHRCGPGLLRAVRGRAPAPGPPRGRRRLVRLLLFLLKCSPGLGISPCFQRCYS